MGQAEIYEYLNKKDDWSSSLEIARDLGVGRKEYVTRALKRLAKYKLIDLELKKKKEFAQPVFFARIKQ